MPEIGDIMLDEDGEHRMMVEPQGNRLYSDEDLGNILRRLNMNMTIAEFYQLTP